MGLFLSFCSALSFSANYVSVRLGMREHSEKDAVMITNFVNFCILGLLSLGVLIYSSPLYWTWKGILFFALAGLFTSFIGRLALFGGIRRIGSARAVAVKNASPMITIFMAIAVIQEKISIIPALGILLILAGLFLMIHRDWKKGGDSLEGKSNRIGIVIALVAMLGFGLGQAFRKLGMVHMNEAIIGAWLGVSTSLFLSLMADCFNGLAKEIPFRLNPKNWNKFFLFAGLFSSLALLLFFSALQFIPIAFVSAISALEPILTIVIASFVLKKDAHNELTKGFYVTLGMVLTGVGLIAFR